MAGHFCYAIRLEAHQVREERPMLSEAAIQRLPGEFFLDKTWRKSKECGELFGSKVQGVFFVGFPKILWHFKIATFHKFTIFFKEIHLVSIPPLEATKIWKKIMEFLEGVISLSRLIHTCRNHLHLLPHFFWLTFCCYQKDTKGFISQSSGKKIWWISKGPSQKETSQQRALVVFWNEWRKTNTTFSVFKLVLKM